MNAIGTSEHHIEEWRNGAHAAAGHRQTSHQRGAMSNVIVFYAHLSVRVASNQWRRDQPRRLKRQRQGRRSGQARPRLGEGEGHIPASVTLEPTFKKRTQVSVASCGRSVCRVEGLVPPATLRARLPCALRSRLHLGPRAHGSQWHLQGSGIDRSQS